MIIKTNNKDYWKTLMLLMFSAQILALVPSLIFYLLNISTGTAPEPASLITGLLLFFITTFLWLYYVFSHILQAFNLPDKQEMFKQINKYRKHFQIFYLPFSISIIPIITIIDRRLFIPNESLETLAGNVLSTVAIPAIFFVPAYILLEYVLDRIICPKVSEHLSSGEIHLFTTLSVLQKYLLISIFMVFGTFFFMILALVPDLRSLDGLQIIAMLIFISVPVFSFVSYYFTTEPKFKEINRHLSEIVTGSLDSTTELSITSQDSLGNLSQLYNATVNLFTIAAEESFRKERLSILGTMSAGIAHEVRNPLGAIKNSAYFLKLKLKEIEDQKVHRHIQIIDTEINRANKIITDLLNFSRVKLPSKENTNISNVINEILEELSTINGKIEMKVKIPLDLPNVFVDSHQIEQVIHNLLINAIESMPDGGKLEIVSKIVEKEIVVNIKDTGTGISEKNKEKIFQPLFTTKGAKGIGLGLALSKQLMILNNGSITFDSEVDKGTTFTIAIPFEIEGNFANDGDN